MKVRSKAGRALTGGLLGTVVTAGALFLTAPPAFAATTASFLASSGLLTVISDSSSNTITVSRDAAGRLFVNGGAVPISGGIPTVGNTQLIQIFGLGGNDDLSVSEANGGMPRGNLFGGSDADTLTGGSGGDMLFGQAGNDALNGRGGGDVLFGGDDEDRLTGGDGDDQAFGENGNDRMVWSNGDDTDLNEGGTGIDRVQVTGSSGSENFTVTAPGVRVRLDRVGASPFSIDIGTSESLSVDTGAGQDRFDASSIVTPSIRLSVNTGDENDAVFGSAGDDVIGTGDGKDVVDGRAGDDQVFLGAGDDIANWRPGDGNDLVDGDADSDRVEIFGSSADERFELFRDGSRVRVTRDLADVAMDLDDLEVARLRASAGVDDITVHDLSGTELTDVEVHLAVTQTGSPDGLRDTVNVEGTAADDTVRVSGTVGLQQVSGLAPRLVVLGADNAPLDRITVAAGDGSDLVDASQLAAPAGVVANGGNGDDVVIGSDGDDVLFGGDGDDALVGRAGTDTLNGGPGTNVLIGGEIVTDGLIPTKAWLAGHARTVGGDSVFDLGGKQLIVPGIPLESLQ